ncbi:hypothetical protein ACTMU2_37220 [Cupriavidus basilensis]
MRADDEERIAIQFEPCQHRGAVDAGPVKSRTSRIGLPVLIHQSAGGKPSAQQVLASDGAVCEIDVGGMIDNPLG